MFVILFKHKELVLFYFNYAEIIIYDGFVFLLQNISTCTFSNKTNIVFVFYFSFLSGKLQEIKTKKTSN